MPRNRNFNREVAIALLIELEEKVGETIVNAICFAIIADSHRTTEERAHCWWQVVLSLRKQLADMKDYVTQVSEVPDDLITPLCNLADEIRAGTCKHRDSGQYVARIARVLQSDYADEAIAEIIREIETSRGPRQTLLPITDNGRAALMIRHMQMNAVR